MPQRAKKQHPVDVPLSREEGLLGAKKYIKVGAVPEAIVNKTELLLFLNFKPDFRPPNDPVSGPFEPYERCAEGFNALVEAVSRNFKVQVISWGAPVWKSLSKQVIGMYKPFGVCANAMGKGFGRVLDLRCDQQVVPYLPLAHPCDRRNFNSHHAEHAHEGFLKMGLGGSSCRAGAA